MTFLNVKYNSDDDSKKQFKDVIFHRIMENKAEKKYQEVESTLSVLFLTDICLISQ